METILQDNTPLVPQNSPASGEAVCIYRGKRENGDFLIPYRRLPVESGQELHYADDALGLDVVLVDRDRTIRNFPGFDPADLPLIEVFTSSRDRMPVIRYDGSIQQDAKGPYLLWELHPDGRYWADEGGFGMEDDTEIYVYARIGADGRLAEPFRIYKIDDRYFDMGVFREVPPVILKDLRVCQSIHTVCACTWEAFSGLLQDAPEGSGRRALCRITLPGESPEPLPREIIFWPTDYALDPELPAERFDTRSAWRIFNALKGNETRFCTEYFVCSENSISGAAAAAAALYLGFEDMPFWKSRVLRPHPKVFSTLCRVFGIYISQEALQLRKETPADQDGEIISVKASRGTP